MSTWKFVRNAGTALHCVQCIPTYSIPKSNVFSLCRSLAWSQQTSSSFFWFCQSQRKKTRESWLSWELSCHSISFAFRLLNSFLLSLIAITLLPFSFLSSASSRTREGFPPSKVIYDTLVSTVQYICLFANNGKY